MAEEQKTPEQSGGAKTAEQLKQDEALETYNESLDALNDELGEVVSDEEADTHYEEMAGSGENDSDTDTGNGSEKDNEESVDKKDEDDEQGDDEQPTTLTQDFLDELSTEFSETGELSDKSYSQLEKAGIPREYVDMYLKGVQAEEAEYLQSMYSKAGGQEEYTKMTQWAENSLTDAETERFNSAVLQGGVTAELAVENLYNKYKASNLDLIDGNNVNNSNANGVYGTWDDYMQDMNDPRYTKDAKYRRQVIAKLQRSKI